MRSVLEYGSPVWDQHGIVVQEELEKIQNRAARLLTGNYNFCPVIYKSQKHDIAHTTSYFFFFFFFFVFKMKMKTSKIVFKAGRGESVGLYFHSQPLPRSKIMQF